MEKRIINLIDTYNFQITFQPVTPKKDDKKEKKSEKNAHSKVGEL